MTKILATISTSTVVTIGLLIYLILTWYHTNRDIDALIDRAQVAANAEDMLQYTTELETNMRSYGMTSGYTAILFTTPANDMSLHYKTVQRIITRLRQVKDLPQNETAYQVALADLRGTLRELSNPTNGWIWTHYIWWMLLVVIGCWGVTALVAKKGGIFRTDFV